MFRIMSLSVVTLTNAILTFSQPFEKTSSSDRIPASIRVGPLQITVISVNQWSGLQIHPILTVVLRASHFRGESCFDQSPG
jgi:hypothetical protein